MEIRSLDDLMKAAVLEKPQEELSEEVSLLLKEAEVVANGIQKEAFIGRARELLGRAVGGAKRMFAPTQSARMGRAVERRGLAEINREIAGEKAMQQFLERHGPGVLLSKSRHAPIIPAERAGFGPVGNLAIGAGTGVPIGMLLAQGGGEE